MPRIIDFQHLATVKESYWQHLRWAWWSMVIFCVLVPLAFVHGLCPWFMPGWPDRVLVHYLQQFQQRRQRTGQADIDS